MAAKMITQKSWNEFRKSGLLLIINQFLHVFGWSIVFDFETYDRKKDDGIIREVYPARVKFRGFTGPAVEKAYRNVSKYMDKNSERLLREANE